jgi:hypothetical protein
MYPSLPAPIIATVADALSEFYTHAELDTQFMYADAPGDAPDGSKVAKAKDWLVRCNKDVDTDPFKVLGKLLEEYMEREIPEPEPWVTSDTYYDNWRKNRKTIEKILANYGYSYFTNGIIRKSGSTGPTRSLEQILRDKDLAAVDAEFKRTMDNIEADPPASLTGACAIIESLCKTYIEENGLPLPKDQSIKPLWNIVKKDLGLNPEIIEDQDLLKIISGVSSIVDGLGALRTHAGSAHGRGKKVYRLKPRHVRLAVHAAHTLATFVIETWDDNNR